jgi:hypothetical protein
VNADALDYGQTTHGGDAVRQSQFYRDETWSSGWPQSMVVAPAPR